MMYKRAENNIDRTENREDFQGYDTGEVLPTGVFKGESANLARMTTKVDLDVVFRK